jgi:hypothetical protein
MSKIMCKRFVAQIFLVAMLAFCSTSKATEWVSGDAGISFQIPDNPSWHQATPPNPQVKLILERTNKTAEVFFAVFSAPPNQQVLNQDFISGFEKGYWPSDKSTKRTGEFFDFKGKKAYKTSGDLFIKDITFKKGAIIWMENKKVFLISIMKRSADPMEDTVIKTFLETAKFISGSKN